MGVWRYGYRKEAAQLAPGILEAAELFHHRLPEAFAGDAREVTKYPVGYPTAGSPQAWATGAPLLFLRILLGLDHQTFQLPDVRGSELSKDYTGLTAFAWRS